MSSANEQLAPPPKPRMSPLDFRNTDLVSRLLAATPPYLYNMSLLPNTYFFSEMLRSFVQAKSDPNRSSTAFQTRRTRKRPWTPLKNESFTKSSTSPKPDQTDWSMKSYAEGKPLDSPLELTTAKISVMNGESDSKLAKPGTYSDGLVDKNKMEMPLQDQVDPLYPSMNQESSPSGLILPPPPPIWYPSLYPAAAPYGIDPLHFFIDLRVSGHIYDRKNQAEDGGTKPEPEDRQKQVKDSFKQSRHASAFAVPTPRRAEEEPQEAKNVKFDVKSMGFEKTYNRTGVNYVMGNITNIYKSIAEGAEQRVKSEASSENASENDNETEEQKEKRVKDLRALIGLELVVDYMNHAKPNARRLPDQSNSADAESSRSPTLEVVAVHDET